MLSDVIIRMRRNLSHACCSIQEEDEYANFLVQEFERGLAKEVAEQTTLRAYLSRKLICAPMRISKKFVGKCHRTVQLCHILYRIQPTTRDNSFFVLGKKVGTIMYKNKVVSSEMAEISAQKHLELEQKCLAALVVQLNASFVLCFVDHKNDNLQCFFSSSFSFYQRANKAGKLQAKSKLSSASQDNGAMTKPAQNVHDKSLLPMPPQQSLQHIKRQVARHHQQQIYHPNGHNPSTNEHGQASSYHTLNRAPYQAGFCPTAHHAGVGNSPTHSRHFVNRYRVTTRCNNSYPPTCQVEREPRAQPSSVRSQQHTTNHMYGTNTAAQSAPLHSNKTETMCPDVSMLDLVTGFDEHAASLNPKPDITAILESRPSSTTWPNNSNFFSGGVEDSPYVTSKSFDDMHKCLGGIDMPSNPSHLDLNGTGSTAQVKALTNNSQPNISAESPYVTSKSFDDMHRCLGVGLPTSTVMSHIDLGDTSSKSGKFQVIDNTESSSAYAKSNTVVDIDTCDREVVDPRSDKLLSAFSPFDGSRVMQEQETAPCNFDTMIRRVSAPPFHGDQLAQAIHGSDHAESKPNMSYGTVSHFNPAQTFNMSYTAPSNYRLATFLNNRDIPLHVHPVSTSTSEQSSDRGNSSPDGADVQSD